MIVFRQRNRSFGSQFFVAQMRQMEICMIIRKGRHEDLAALLEIYNYEVVNGTATFDIHPKTLKEWAVWFDLHNKGDNHPLYVGVEAGEVVGYATLSPYRPKEAYVSTVELSIYVSPEHRGHGVATELMEHIIGVARDDEETHMIVSVITAGNEASTELHRKFGFTHSGTIPEVGVKFGRKIGIDTYYLMV